MTDVWVSMTCSKNLKSVSCSVVDASRRVFADDATIVACWSLGFGSENRNTPPHRPSAGAPSDYTFQRAAGPVYTSRGKEGNFRNVDSTLASLYSRLGGVYVQGRVGGAFSGVVLVLRRY